MEKHFFLLWVAWTRCPCVPGTGGVGTGDPASQRALLWASRRCALWGWWEFFPGGGGGALRRGEGRLRSGARPPPTAHPQGGLSGSAAHVLWARVSGCGGLVLSLWFACPAGRCLPRGRWVGVPGGWSSTVVRGVPCQENVS